MNYFEAPDDLRQKLKEAQKAHTKAIFDNVRLGIVWSDDYRATLNAAGNPHADIFWRIALYKALWAREMQCGAEARIAKALADEVKRIQEEREALTEALEYL